MQFLKNYFRCNHRMTRKAYFFTIVPIILILLTAILCVEAPEILETQQSSSNLEQQKTNGTITQTTYDLQTQEIFKKEAQETHQTSLFLIALIGTLLILPAYTMRLKDLGYTPWLGLLMFVGYIHLPLIVMIPLHICLIILGLIMLFKRGTKGPNRYGPDPLELKTAG